MTMVNDSVRVWAVVGMAPDYDGSAVVLWTTILFRYSFFVNAAVLDGSIHRVWTFNSASSRSIGTGRLILGYHCPRPRQGR